MKSSYLLLWVSPGRFQIITALQLLDLKVPGHNSSSVTFKVLLVYRKCRGECISVLHFLYTRSTLKRAPLLNFPQNTQLECYFCFLPVLGLMLLLIIIMITLLLLIIMLIVIFNATMISVRAKIMYCTPLYLHYI